MHFNDWKNAESGAIFATFWRVLAAARQHYPLAGSKCRRTIHTLQSGKNRPHLVGVSVHYPIA
ncbi:hypothetical protein, partial [Xanthomonas oryzae]|uniref:hypothetical protein n=1 Tax=Xanthomonas oryzae TaxID=347 RepID=UPI003CCF7AE6